MKRTLNQVSLITLKVLLPSLIFAQQPWRVGGNSNTQLGGNLQPRIGTDGNRPLLIETNSAESVDGMDHWS